MIPLSRNSIFHEGVVSAKVWFVNILIIEIRIIWQILIMRLMYIAEQFRCETHRLAVDIHEFFIGLGILLMWRTKGVDRCYYF